MARPARQPWGLWVCVLALSMAMGCAPKIIPGTNIEDTPDTRAIISVMERFRTALEARDADAVMALVSPTFKDTGGTSNPEDDLDYAMLQKKLPERLNRTSDVRLDIDVRAITMHKNWATAIYYYNARFRMPTLTSRPQNESDLKQMMLKKENGQWKVASGI